MGKGEKFWNWCEQRNLGVGKQTTESGVGQRGLHLGIIDGHRGSALMEGRETTVYPALDASVAFTLGTKMFLLLGPQRGTSEGKDIEQSYSLRLLFMPLRVDAGVAKKMS